MPAYNAGISRLQSHVWFWHGPVSASRHGQIAPATPSPAWLGIYIVPRWSHPGRVIASDSVVPSSSWLGGYIAPWPSCLGSTVVSTTRQWHHAASWSPTSTIYDFSGKQTHCQLIRILFTIMFGSRANAGILMCYLAASWSMYVSKTHVWRL
jgi:hypothetical protein